MRHSMRREAQVHADEGGGGGGKGFQKPSEEERGARGGQDRGRALGVVVGSLRLSGQRCFRPLQEILEAASVASIRKAQKSLYKALCCASMCYLYVCKCEVVAIRGRHRMRSRSEKV